jgi:hypothetical protein
MDKILLDIKCAFHSFLLLLSETLVLILLLGEILSEHPQKCMYIFTLNVHYHFPILT